MFNDPPRAVDIGPFEVTETRLGRGGQCSAVYLGRHCEEGYKVAVKLVNLKQNPRPFVELKQLATLQKEEGGGGHPSIVKLLSQFTNDKCLLLILEYCDGKDLRSALKKWGESSVSLDEYTVRRLGKQLLDGLQFLHERNIVHGDLKPANILLTFKNIRKADIRIANFEGQKNLAERVIGGTPPPCYMAPERLRGGDCACDASAEVWAAGLILYEMMFGVHPFPSISLIEQTAQSSDPLRFPMDTTSKRVSPDFQDLVQRMCEADPSKRIKLSDALNHAWFTTPMTDPSSTLQTGACVTQQRLPFVDMARAVLWAADEVERHPARQLRLYLCAAAVATSFGSKNASRHEPLAAQLAKDCLARADQIYKDSVSKLPLQQRLVPPSSVVIVEIVLLIIRIIVDPCRSASYRTCEIDQLFVAATTLCEVIVEDPDTDSALSNEAQALKRALEDARVVRSL